MSCKAENQCDQCIGRRRKCQLKLYKPTKQKLCEECFVEKRAHEETLIFNRSLIKYNQNKESL